MKMRRSFVLPNVSQQGDDALLPGGERRGARLEVDECLNRSQGLGSAGGLNDGRCDGRLPTGDPLAPGVVMVSMLMKTGE